MLEVQFSLLFPKSKLIFSYQELPNSFWNKLAKTGYHVFVNLLRLNLKSIFNISNVGIRQYRFLASKSNSALKLEPYEYLVFLCCCGCSVYLLAIQTIRETLGRDIYALNGILGFRIKDIAKGCFCCPHLIATRFFKRKLFIRTQYSAAQRATTVQYLREFVMFMYLKFIFSSVHGAFPLCIKQNI